MHTKLRYLWRSAYSRAIRTNSLSKLLQKKEPPSELPPPPLKADYNKILEEVYHDVVLDHIDRTKSLEILTTAQHDPDDTCALFKPSCVSRWDYCIGTPTLGLYSSNHFASAHKDVTLTLPPPNIQNTLTVRGTLVTRMIKHTDLFDTPSFDPSLPTTIKTRFNSRPTSLGNKSHS